jgi:hypothetical protein
MDKNFYVYCHRTKTDGKCFYIGKGTGDRYQTTFSRNRYWYNIVDTHGFEPVILINNITEEKAFELEAHICEQVGYDNLVNIRKEKGWGGHSHSKETRLKMSKAILQYDLKGYLIKKWDSATQAAQSLDKDPAAITECCRGHRQSIYGFQWRRMDNPINEPVSFIPKKPKLPKLPAYYNPIEQYDLMGNYIKTWNNIKEAIKTLNISSPVISNCLKGIYNTAGGYKWVKSNSLTKKGGYCA